jgi:hypothetical protein
MPYPLNENSRVEVDVTGQDGITRHESWDAVDMLEGGYSFHSMVVDYKADGAKKVVIEIVFGDE